MENSDSDQVSGAILSKTSPIYCDICLESEIRIAHGFCKTCGEYLCKDCFEYHLKPKPSRNHILLNEDDMPKRTHSKTAGDNVRTDEVCVEHSSETLHFYCPVHEQFYCGTCIALNHKKCENVEYIPDIASNYIASDSFQEFEGQVEDMVLYAEECKSKCLQAVDTSEKQIVKVLHQIVHYKEGLINEVSKRADEIVQKVNEHNLKTVKYLSDKQKQCALVKIEFESLKKQITLLKSDMKQGELYTLAKVKMEELEKFNGILSEANIFSDVETFNFYPNKGIFDTLCEPNALGDFSKSKLDTTSSDARKVSASSEKDEVAASKEVSVDGKVSQQMKLVPPRGTSTPSVDDNDDKPLYFKKLLPSCEVDLKAFTDEKRPWVTGITNVNENDHMHAIAVYNSRLIAVIDSNQKKIRIKKDVQHGPWDVTSVRMGEIVATLPFKKQLVFVKILSIKRQPGSLEMKILKHVDVTGQCHSITNDGELLYVSYQNPGKIECLRLDGVVVRKFELDKDGAYLFVEPQYIICNAQSKLLYVTDWENNTITCLSTDGHIKATFKEETLKAPTGLTLDKDGNVFVAGYHSNNIIQLSPTFKQFQLVLDRRDKVVFPQALTFSAKFNKVCIGFRDNEILSVFKVK